MKTSLLLLVSTCALAIAGCAGGTHVASVSSAPSTEQPPTSSPSQPTNPAPAPPSDPAPAPPTNPTPTDPSAPPSNAVTLANIQASPGWESWGQLAPLYADCDSPCSGVTWSMTQGMSSPSLSGNAAQFQIGGTTPYSDVLWSNPVIGQFSTQGLPDNDHALLPTIHNFIYDADFYVTDASKTQVLEFDINMYINSVGMTWAHQCNHLGDGDWDIAVMSGWKSTGVPCNLIDNSWNHVTIQAQLESNGSLLFQTITLNGVTANINQSYPSYSVPASWYGITVSYQMDGNAEQAQNTTYVDNLSLTYW